MGASSAPARRWSTPCPRVDTRNYAVLYARPDFVWDQAVPTPENDVVKRIKKRIPKAEGAETEGEELVEEEVEDDAPTETATETLEHLSDKLGEVNQDEFVDYGAKALEWVVKHRFKLVGVFVFAVAAATVSHFVMKSRRGAVEAKAAAFFEGAKPLNEARNLLPQFVVGATEKPKEPLSPEERKKRLEEAATSFGKARDANAGAPLAKVSGLGLAGARFELGKFDEALKLYDEVAGDEKVDPVARAMAQQGRAAALEALAKPAEAIDAWKRLESLNPKSYGLIAGMQVGRLLENQGKTADAKSHYEKVQKDNAKALEHMANADVKRELERRLGRLSDGT